MYAHLKQGASPGDKLRRRSRAAALKVWTVLAALASLGCLGGSPETGATPQARIPDADALASARTPPTEASAIRPGQPISASMVRVEPGTFTMGTPTPVPYPGAPGLDETPHSVTLSQAFLISAHEVTQAQFRAATGYNPSRGAAFGADDRRRNREHCPVDDASWCDAVLLANVLSAREALTPAYTLPPGFTSRLSWDACNDAVLHVTWNRSADGYRLPTEAEWERAARAGASDAHGGQPLEEIAWTAESKIGVPAPVATKRPNAWGLYDMLGNASEWTWDVAGPYPKGAVRNPTGATPPPPKPEAWRTYPPGIWRVVRGGDIDSPAVNVNVTRRGFGSAAGGTTGGIRLARNAPR